MNNIDDICFNRAEFCNKLNQFFVIQLDWIYTQIESYPNEEYWHQVFGRKKKKFIIEYFLIYLD